MVMKKRVLAIFALMLLTGTLAACNTVSGFGQDVSNTGHAISRAAN